MSREHTSHQPSRKKHTRRIKNATKEKVLLLLATGVLLSLDHGNQSWKVLGKFAKEWKKINRRELMRAVQEFRHDRVVAWKVHGDGSITITLTEHGKERALKQRFDDITITHPKRWDKRWRFVLFDIPEKQRMRRDAFRRKLEEIGFKKVQQSLWAIPHPCKDQIDFIVEFLELRPFVRFLETTAFANDEDLRLKFRI